MNLQSLRRRVTILAKPCTTLAALMALFCFQFVAAVPAHAADCNGNGVDDAVDIAGGTNFDCNNNGIPDSCEFTTEFTQRPAISTGADGALSVFAADLDDDGDIDVLSAADLGQEISWYENSDGLGNFDVGQVINTTAGNARAVYAADLDGDGHVDVLSASGFANGRISWHENTDGLGTFGPEQIISIDVESPGSIMAVDLDGDGDADVLSTSGLAQLNWESKVAWYENTDGLGTFGPQQIITTEAINPTSVYAVDLDGDTDIDVLSASFAPDRIAWYENTDGLGNFGPLQIISTIADFPQSVFAGDLDGDGDADVLSASFADNKIAWYENLDGAGAFGSELVIATTAFGAEGVFAKDLDDDADLDVGSVSFTDNKVAWYENIDGLGDFSQEQIVTLAADGAISAFAADFNGDGKEDLLYASYFDDTIAWYANFYQDCNGNQIIDECDISGTTSDDCNFNGAPDECDIIEMDCDDDGSPDDCQVASLNQSLSGPVSTIVCPNDDAQISVTSSIPGLDYQWLKNGAPLIEGVDAVGTATPTLTIPNTESADEGAYSCEVSMGCILTITGSADLTALELLSIVQQPAALTNTCSGNTVVIAVNAAGDALTYEWLQNGLALPNQPGKYEGVGTNTLQIVNANVNDLAEYACIVRDQCGGEETTTSAFIQFGDATFVVQPVGQCVTEGDTVSYTATADGGPYSVFRQWYKDGVQLFDGGNVSGTFTDTLMIQNVTASNEGIYSQRALTLGANCVVFSDSVELAFDSCTCVTPGDLDADGDLDLADLQVFMGCFGSDLGEKAGCACANVDQSDDSIDLDDWAAYAAILTGP